jgi:hypothetical protein
MDLSKLPKLSQTPAPPDNASVSHEVTDASSTGGAAPKVELYCRCGAPITPGTNFCSHCGANYLEATGSRVHNYRDREADLGGGSGPEAWITIAIAVILIFLSPRIWQYYLMPSKFTWTFNDAQGAPLPYPNTEFYWSDLGVAAFCAVMILEAVVMLFIRKAPLLMVVLGLTVLTALLNVYVLMRTFNILGFQILNALAVAFTIYIAFYQFALLKNARRS